MFCEKPLVPTVDECLEIQRVAKEKGKLVAVGFQWSYSKAIQQLKRDILPQIIAVNAAMEYIPVCDFPKHYICKDENQLYIKGIEEVLEHCYEKNKLPNELDVEWSKPSESITIKDYHSFKGIADSK